MTSPSSKRFLVAVLLPLIAAVLLPLLLKRPASDREVVVYCAHDSIFADDILKAFEQQTGIRVTVRYDEEASKSLGLTQLLLAEKAAPRCDVFWNNQTLGTMRLAKAGVLAACPIEWFARISQKYRDADHRWCGFAGRFRVWIVNTERMPKASIESVEKAFAGEQLQRCSIAVPLFGTTLTHYSELAAELGLAELQNWHQSLRDRGIREARGNGAVRDLVAEGACDFGLTDTDDVFAALDAGKPVQMFPCRLPSGHTICIPNTVALIQGCPHPEPAGELIRYLLSEEVELQLAKSAARQIPLGAVDPEQLPVELRPLIAWSESGGDPAKAAEFDQPVLDWLTRFYSGDTEPQR
ncbi:MAG: Iron deficiency-induced protein precursor [Planctomycetota bacterium]|jgi:iron(III) transport system substrate-binding protein